MTKSERNTMRDLASTPGLWVQRPFLPMYRDLDDGLSELGLVVEGRRACKVYLCNLVDAVLALQAVGADPKSKSWSAWLRKQASVSYSNFDVAYDDGWRID